MQSRRHVRVQAELQHECNQQNAAATLLRIWMESGLDATNVYFTQHKGRTMCKVEIHGKPVDLVAFLQPAFDAIKVP
jgi:hypothetical protein